MVVGPTSIGKSTVMHEAARQDPDFTYVRAFTTRPQRAGEAMVTYDHITEEQAKALKASGQALTYIIHPTSGYIYGTTLASYQSEFNLMDTLSGSVEAYKALPFGRTITLSLTAPSNAWEHWFRIRYPVTNEEARQRLAEAKLSIKWSLQQPDMVWLLNELDDVAGTAARLVGLCRGTHTEAHTSVYAEDMLKTIDILLS